MLLGVKQACNKAFREVMPLEFVAVTQQYAQQENSTCTTREKYMHKKRIVHKEQITSQIMRSATYYK